MRSKRKFIILSSIIALTAMIATIAAYAWFYYPAQTDVKTNTDDEVPVEMNLYKYAAEYNSESDAYVYQWRQVTDENGALTINPSVTFFQWGDEFIAENFYAEYYVLECTLDSKSYSSGNFKALIDASFDCKNGYCEIGDAAQEFTYNYIDNGTTSTTNVNLRVPLVTLSYCVYDDSSIVIENSTAFVDELTNAEYTDFVFDGEEAFTTPSLEFTSSIEKSYQTEETSVYLDDDTIRLIFFIKVDDNSTEVNDYMQHVDDIGEHDILLDNDITLTVSIRSIPKKETE